MSPTAWHALPNFNPQNREPRANRLADEMKKTKFSGLCSLVSIRFLLSVCVCANVTPDWRHIEVAKHLYNHNKNRARNEKSTQSINSFHSTNFFARLTPRSIFFASHHWCVSIGFMFSAPVNCVACRLHRLSRVDIELVPPKNCISNTRLTTRTSERKTIRFCT